MILYNGKLCMNSFLSLEQTFSLLVYAEKFYSSWVMSTVKFSLLPNKVSVRMSFLHCMNVLLHSINHGELCLFIHLGIPFGCAYLRGWGDELFIQVSSRVWHIINCWTFVEWISEWRMKEGPFQVYEECFQNPGEESVETSQGRGFPCENAWDKGWVSGEQPEEQLGRQLVMLKRIIQLPKPFWEKRSPQCWADAGIWKHKGK